MVADAWEGIFGGSGLISLEGVVNGPRRGVMVVIVV